MLGGKSNSELRAMGSPKLGGVLNLTSNVALYRLKIFLILTIHHIDIKNEQHNCSRRLLQVTSYLQVGLRQGLLHFDEYLPTHTYHECKVSNKERSKRKRGAIVLSLDFSLVSRE